MASILKKIGNSSNVPFQTFEVDNFADMQTLDVSRAIMGSRCYIINTGETYALNSDKQWKKVPAGSGGGGGQESYAEWGSISGNDPGTSGELPIEQGKI